MVEFRRTIHLKISIVFFSPIGGVINMSSTDIYNFNFFSVCESPFNKFCYIVSCPNHIFVRQILNFYQFVIKHAIQNSSTCSQTCLGTFFFLLIAKSHKFQFSDNRVRQMFVNVEAIFFVCRQM